MPRGLRVFVEGGIYHVYNRFASGEPVFADPEEALAFIELLRNVRDQPMRKDATLCAEMPPHAPGRHLDVCQFRSFIGVGL